jgi:hypothetical protein
LMNGARDPDEIANEIWASVVARFPALAKHE